VAYKEVASYLSEHWTSLTRGAKVAKRWIPSKATFYRMLKRQNRPVNRQRKKVMLKNTGASQDDMDRAGLYAQLCGF
jgi:hypothetical protein